MLSVPGARLWEGNLAVLLQCTGVLQVELAAEGDSRDGVGV